MTASLSDDLQKAVAQTGGKPLEAEHAGTHQVYYIYSEDLHRRATQALQQQEDLDSIQAGIDAANEGRESTLAEADAHIRRELNFPPRT